ncbi:MAG: thioredoxin family protein [Burkholderiales bacterium]|nr:thioredoxin family protein [Burkholderiales bacterium]
MSHEAAVDPGATAPARRVICLCAQWCDTCRDYRAVFDALGAAHPGLQFIWVDIEDQADLVGDVEVETFPTLLIADGPTPRFFGPLTPQPQTLARVIEGLAPQGAGLTAAPELQALLDGVLAATPNAGHSRPT